MFCVRERFKIKNSKKKLTNVSFAFTHTYTLVKTNIFGIFSQACLENFEKCVKTPKKTWYIVPCLPVVVSFFLLFFNLSLCHSHVIHMTSHCRHLKVATLVWYAAVPAGIWPEKLWENSSSRLELLGEAANEPPSTSTRRSRHSSTPRPHHHPLPQMQIDITITNGNSCLMEGKG